FCESILPHLCAAGVEIPVIVGLPSTVSEDQLKGLGSAAASAGSVAMFHAVGCTPEAPTMEAALGGMPPTRTIVVDMADVRAARDQLSTTETRQLGAVSLGTPHYSLSEFELLVNQLGGRSIHPDVHMYVSTGRDVLHVVEQRGWAQELTRSGVQLVADTCTYITPIIAERPGAVMTDSAKWAYYAPSNLGLDVIFGSLEDCVESAVRGRVSRDESGWTDG
ncbi:MAG: aconitase X, partial [Acidimicrobiales bacterium]